MITIWELIHGINIAYKIIPWGNWACYIQPGTVRRSGMGGPAAGNCDSRHIPFLHFSSPWRFSFSVTTLWPDRNFSKDQNSNLGVACKRITYSLRMRNQLLYLCTTIDSIDYAGIGNAPSHIQTLLIMPYGVMEKMESTSIPALFQPVQWFYCGKPGQ